MKLCEIWGWLSDMKLLQKDNVINKNTPSDTKKGISKEIPSVEKLENELKRERYKRNYFSVMRSTIYTLTTVAAVAVLVAVLLLPVLQIYGTSMTPTLYEGNIVVSVKGSSFAPGDIVAFYYNNKILIKRVVGNSGDWVNIDDSGNVYINGSLLDEPYVEDKAVPLLLKVMFQP